MSAFSFQLSAFSFQLSALGAGTSFLEAVGTREIPEPAPIRSAAAGRESRLPPEARNEITGEVRFGPHRRRRLLNAES
jgi:hypothetical protein